MLRLKPGDRVKIMDDTESYTVVRRLPGDLVLVKTDDGLELPLKAKSLILSVIRPENISFSGAGKKNSSVVKKKRSGQHERTRSKVVDLHMSASNPGTNGLATIEIQLLRFRAELEAAIREGYQEITFIHGVGSGMLKQELRKTLSSNYPLFSYHDGSYIKYGYGGATHVLINKKKI